VVILSDWEPEKNKIAGQGMSLIEVKVDEMEIYSLVCSVIGFVLVSSVNLFCTSSDSHRSDLVCIFQCSNVPPIPTLVLHPVQRIRCVAESCCHAIC